MPGKRRTRTRPNKVHIYRSVPVNGDASETGVSDKDKKVQRFKGQVPVWRAPPMIKSRFDPQFDFSHIVTVDTSKAKSSKEVIRMCIRELGWKEFPYGRKDTGPCDIYWHGLSFFDNADIQSGRVNKFPGMGDITKKISLCRTLDMMREIYPNEFDFYPRSWFLPAQYHEFASEVALMRRHARKKQPPPTFIVKPDEGSQGEGIYLLRDPSDYTITNKFHIVQEYLAKPFLLEGYKFDLRVYISVQSVCPLKFAISKEGLARFCTVSYQEPKRKNLRESYMHLTNYSLNKFSQGYVHTDMDDTGSKRTMTSVLQKLENMGHSSTHIWQSIEDVITKTMLAIAPELLVEYQSVMPVGKPGPSCFQILGFDILLMDDLKPMLLEINANPSLRLDYEQEIKPGVMQHVPSAIDEEVKKSLVKETLILNAPEAKLRPKSRHSSVRRKSRLKTLRSTACSVDSFCSENDGWYTPSSFHYNDNNGKFSPEPPANDSDSDNNVSYASDPSNDMDPSTGANLYNLYPDKYTSEFDHLKLLDRVAAIFIHCLGIRGSLRLGPTGFRTFTRKCRLSSGTFNNAVIDIMFIELQRKWEFMNPDRTAGLCFQGFVDAFYEIAKRKFRSTSKVESVENLLDFCEASLHFGKYSVCKSLPKVEMTKADKQAETFKGIYSSPTHRRRSHITLDEAMAKYLNFPSMVPRSKTVMQSNYNHDKRLYYTNHLVP